MINEDILQLAAQNYVEAKSIERVQYAWEPIAKAMEEELDPLLRQAFNDPAPVQYLLTGRRRGKTEYLGRRLTRGALSTPRSINPYILPTAKQARLVCWPIIKRIVLRHVPDAKIGDHEMTVVIPERGTIVAGGCECLADVGKWFGMPFAEADVDECGNYPGYLKNLRDDSLKPGTMDFAGQMAFAGNPGLVMEGPWFEWTGPGRLAKAPLYKGDARDNPHLRVDVQAFFQEVLDENGWTWETPTFRRMYLGEWCEDAGALVYPFDYAKNNADILPEYNDNGYPLEEQLWRFVIAVDPAGVGTTGIAVLAAHPDLRTIYVILSESHTGMLVAQLADRVRVLQSTYRQSQVVMDVGGLGSTHGQEFTKIFAIGVEAALKSEKPSAIRMFRDALIIGRIKVLSGERNDAVRTEWAVLGWDDKRLQHNPDQPDHCADACLYGYRYLRHYVQSEPANSPEYGSPEWWAEEEQRIREQRIRKYGMSRGGVRGKRVSPWQ